MWDERVYCVVVTLGADDRQVLAAFTEEADAQIFAAAQPTRYARRRVPPWRFNGDIDEEAVAEFNLGFLPVEEGREYLLSRYNIRRVVISVIPAPWNPPVAACLLTPDRFGAVTFTLVEPVADGDDSDVE